MNAIDKIRSLEHGQIVRYRCGRKGREGDEWGEWGTGPIYVQKREVDLKKSLRRNCIGAEWERGAVIGLTPLNESTAEYGECDYSEEFDYFSNEDYCFQIDWESN